MSDLDESEIDKFLGIPMSSELDRVTLGGSDWYSDDEEMDMDNADSEDEDPDFVPSSPSIFDSEFDNEDNVYGDMNMDTSELVNDNERVIDDSMGEELNESEVLNEVNGNQNEPLNEVGLNGNQYEPLNGVNGNENEDVGAVNNDVYVPLSVRYNKLKKKADKAKMKKEELDKWKEPEGKQEHIVFEGNPKLNINLPTTAEPIEYYSQFLTNDIIQLMVDETNRNASQVLQKVRLSRSSRLRKWRPTNVEEMKKFLGLVIYMGLVPMPRLTDYWSKRVIYSNLVARQVMSRNRFQLLLRFWHFSDNETADKEDRLAKIAPVVNHLNQCFRSKKTPGENIVVDESMIPFRGRLIFRQYNPNKTHKYGVKIFKICDTTGYTLKLKIYMGKGTGKDDGSTLATSVVMHLMTDYLDQGHTLYLDNFYTSLDLANILLPRKTHVVGTLIANRAWFPHKKTIPEGLTLEPGEMHCLEYPNGTVYTRWLDKREVRMMSTKHPAGFEDTGKKTRNGNPILKPTCVVEYNKAKMGIDLSDQMAAYSTAVRKSMRWYHKIAEELLLGTAIVNAWLAYKENTNGAFDGRKKLYSITAFREKIVYSLLGIEDAAVQPVQNTGHHLSESETFIGEGKNRRRSRKNCKVCYKKAMDEGGRKSAKNLKKVTTFCNMCPSKPYLCKKCFLDIHK